MMFRVSYTVHGPTDVTRHTERHATRQEAERQQKRLTAMPFVEDVELTAEGDPSGPQFAREVLDMPTNYQHLSTPPKHA